MYFQAKNLEPYDAPVLEFVFFSPIKAKHVDLTKVPSN